MSDPAPHGLRKDGTPAKKRGPKRPHRGQLQPGYDPRRPQSPQFKGHHIAQLARVHTEDALDLLAEAMHAKGEGYVVRLAAANALLDRAWGKAPSAALISVEDSSGPVEKIPTATLLKIASQAAEVSEEIRDAIEGELVESA